MDIGRVIVIPTPTALPLMAAMTGFWQRWIAIVTCGIGLALFKGRFGSWIEAVETYLTPSVAVCSRCICLVAQAGIEVSAGAEEFTMSCDDDAFYSRVERE